MSEQLFTVENIVFNPDKVDEMLKGPTGEVALYLAKVCVQIAGQAQELCPVDTGRLRASIRWMISVDEGSLVGYVGSDVDYTIYVELGTMYMNAEPFLRPAVDTVLGHVR